MIGVGNVGEFLAGKKEGNTYLTRDGGITWREIRQGPYMWEYGDQGSIILIVDEFEPTDKVFYSLNEGTTWEEFSLDNKMLVDDITTVPSDTSRKFLLWGKATGSGERIMTVQIDFEGLTDKRCEQPKDGNDGDFEIWEPKHPRQANGCLFGHKQKYYRKIPDHTCYVGSRSPLPYGDLENCECDYHDFECDFNYERTKENICRLVKGVIPPDHEQACAANSSLVEWYPPSGYRRIPLDTCTGGKELDKEATPRPCPGHEEEFREKHGTSGVAIFFSVIFSLGAAAAIGYWIWTKWQSGFGYVLLPT